MSLDPASEAPLPQDDPDALAERIYRPALADDDSALKGGNRVVTIPLTLAITVLFALTVWQLGKTKLVQNAIKKTVGIDLTELKDEVAAPAPRPAAPAPVAPPKPVEKDPPPPTPVQESVPERPPRELPKEDLSKAAAGPPSSSTPPIGSAPSEGGSSSRGSGVKPVEVSFDSVKIKYQPPPPPYPPIAKHFNIQGTVVVQITIGLDGVPIKAVAVEGPAQLRTHAEHYAMAWRFFPAAVDGAPAIAWFKLTMPFHLR